jgi:hypothetical protein
MFVFSPDSKSVTLLVDIREIKKVLIHFGRGMPVLFLYIMPSAAARIRAALNMESKLGPYYDPSSQGNFLYLCTLHHMLPLAQWILLYLDAICLY